MSKQTNGYQLAQIKTERSKIQNSDGTNLITIATGGANDSWVYNIEITSTDTVDRTVNIIHSDGTNDDIIMQVSVPSGSGQSTTKLAVTLIQTQLMPALLKDPSQNYFRNLPSGEFLKAQLSTGNVTSGKEIRFRVTRGDF